VQCTVSSDVEATISIYTVNGLLVYSQKVQLFKGLNIQRIQTENLRNGEYFIHLNDGTNDFKTFRIFK
jgi:hypothetical protein